MKTTRIPHAPGTPLPELADFLAPFRVHFHRSEGPQALERYLTGLLTEHPNKNCDTIAQVVPGTSQGHRIKIGGLGRMANSAFGGKMNLCGTCSHLFTIFVVYLVVDNKYNIYVL